MADDVVDFPGTKSFPPLTRAEKLMSGEDAERCPKTGRPLRDGIGGAFEGGADLQFRSRGALCA
jgi:hypothetical protein